MPDPARGLIATRQGSGRWVPPVWLLLPVLALSAWLLSNMVQRIIVEQVRPIPSLPGLAAVDAADLLPADAPAGEPGLDRDLFSSGEASPGGGGPTGCRGGSPPPAQLPPVRLPVSLVGTVVASDRAWSLAFVTDARIRSTDPYRLGDLVAGRGRVVAILSDRVILDVDGQRMQLTLAEEQGLMLPQASGGDAPLPASDLLSQLGPGRYRVDGERLRALLARPAELSHQARVAMAFSEDGAIDGIRLTGLARDSLLRQVGLERSDVIRRVNGFALDSPERMLEVYRRLKNARRIEVEVDAASGPRTLRFDIE